MNLFLAVLLVFSVHQRPQTRSHHQFGRVVVEPVYHGKNPAHGAAPRQANYGRHGHH